MRYLVKLSYDGSEFFGFQRLKNKPSVQQELENVLSKINKETVLVKGASRTDCKVHAIDQAIHFDLKHSFSCKKLAYLLNRMLPSSIKVCRVKKVSDNFHARFKVKKKVYEYRVCLEEKNPFLAKYAYCTYETYSLSKMKEASKVFLGTHDFHNFVSGKRDNYMSSIDRITIKKKGKMIYFTFVGKSFYRYMVRHLVGALLEVGNYKVTIDQLENALNSKEDISFLVAPPEGLYLKKITY